MSPAIEASVEAEGWWALEPEALAARAAGAALRSAALAPADYAVSLLFADDRRVAELNLRFRNRPAATNVLSWPAFPLARATPGARPPPPPARPPGGFPVALGDIALAYDTIVREAGRHDLAIRAHATHLIIHAVMHLLGYDHVADADAALMEELERVALASLRTDVPRI